MKADKSGGEIGVAICPGTAVEAGAEPMKRRVAIFGAGIAGLAAAHELTKRGYDVAVYEANEQAGGFFRSARRQSDGVPSEYSWHGLGPWYHNAFDIMKDTPFDENVSVFEAALSRPIEFGIFPDRSDSRFYRGIFSIPRMFGFRRLDAARWFWLMLKTWTANERTQKVYSRQNAAERWKPLLHEQAYLWWRSCFGPWIGSDWKNASLHHAGQFFRKQLISRPSHRHPADACGPAWSHGARDGWLLFRGPSSEYWFKPWIRHLRGQGARFFFRSPLEELEYDGAKVTGAVLSGGARVEADFFVLATTPFAAAEIIARTPALERRDQLSLLKELVQDGPHVQVSFRLAFADEIRMPKVRIAVVIADSEFNLTVFAQEQVWDPQVSLGEGVRSLWTGTSCVSSEPGRIYGRPVERCLKEEFVEEVKAQIYGCEALNRLVREANDGRSLEQFRLLEVEVWHEWIFSREGIQGPQPKWVNTTNTQPFQPNQSCSVANLFLAGSHTRTEADVWSIEGAVESGRRAARAIDPTVPLMHQYKPRWLGVLGAMDDYFFAVGLPHFLDCFVASLGVVAVATFLVVLLG